ncbi:MAG TPA: pilus assembly protein TadG-related protein [Xanthobacteraceae bacterium]|jgi:Flp pilus assembly protein TadG|nr:pilus assembly protein TadG-related protein [Xanthobacteraceae bacterium]
MFAPYFGKLFSKFIRHAVDLRRNTRGNVAIITALATIPMIAAVGCVIDYTTASMIKTKLQASADAAALAAISNNSPLIAVAKNMNGDGTVTDTGSYTQNFFNANLSGAPENTGYAGLSSSASVTKTGMILTSRVTFSANVPTTFMGIAGFNNVQVSGSSTASYTLLTYIDFYLMLDVSGSMSFPSTADEQARLMAVNPDNLHGSNGYPGGCTFACHFSKQGTCGQTSSSNPYQGTYPLAGTTTNPGSGGYCQGFIISRLGTTPTSFASGTSNDSPNNKPTKPCNTTTNICGNGMNVNWNNTQVSSCPNPGTTSCIQLRADAVGYAVNALLSEANTEEQKTGVANEFRVGLYPFIVNLYSYFPLTTNVTATGPGTINNAASNLATLLDTGANTNLGSGGTHFENAFPSMNSLITSVGTGTSSTNTIPYVFLVTDGSQDCQVQSNGNWSNGGGGCSPYQNSATTINTSLCTTLKNRGITIAVLYIPYQTIQNPNANFASNEDGYANSNIPNIPGKLQACASPNFYYTANTPTDITNALVEMFHQAVNTAHVTN